MRTGRCIVLVAIAAAVMLTMTTCSKKTGEPGKVTIRLQIHWAADTARGKAIRAILDDFEAKNPDISVELLGGAGDDVKLLTQIAGGNPPDVMETAYRNVQRLAKYDLLMQLDGLTRNKDAFYRTLWQLGTYEGTLYGYPWFGHTIQLVYNKKRFKEAGIEAPPATWEELYEIARKLTRDTDGDGKPDEFGLSLPGKQHNDTTWMFTMFLHQAGGKLVEQRGGKWCVAINSPEGLEALEFYLELTREVCPPGADNKMGREVMADFRSGKAAMEYQGPWGVTDIWLQEEYTQFPVSAALVPAGKGGRAAELGANMTVIPKSCKHPAAALKLVEYLGSRPAQTLLMEGEKTKVGFVPFRVPVRTDLEALPIFKKHPEFLPFMRGFATPSIEMPIPEWMRVRDEIYKAKLNKAILGLATPAEVLAEIQRAGDLILSE